MRRSHTITGVRAFAAKLACAALACAVATAPVTCLPQPARAEETAPGSTFNDAYTAWSGYATTAAENAIAGAVPVTSPATDAAAWSAPAAEGESAPVPAIALRQRGQATYAYVAVGTQLAQYDAATGASAATARLLAPTLGTYAFVDSALAVPLQNGSVAVFDEDLNASWTSEAVDGLAQDGAGWTSCSGVAAGKGCIFVTFYSYEENHGVALLAAFSQVDGSLLWQAQLGRTRSGVRDRACAPALYYDEGAAALLATDGGDGLYLVDAQTGEVRDTWAVAGAGDVARLAVLTGAGGAGYVVAASDGSVCTVAAEDGKLVLGGILNAGVDVAACAPVQAGDQVLLGGADGNLYAVQLAQDGSSLELGSALALGVAPASLLTAGMGENARAMDLLVYAALKDGSVVRVTCDGAALNAADAAAAETLQPATTAQPAAAQDPTAVLLLNRDGTLLCATAAGVYALAPDTEDAVATPVGGSNGLDTLGASLSGIALPNGVGLGAGVLVFALAFGAYAVIRNGGGKSSRDEGLDAWRARGDAGDADGDGSASGSRTRGGRR